MPLITLRLLSRAQLTPDQGIHVATKIGRITNRGRTVPLHVRLPDRDLFGKY
jgi:hypothetical protein